MLIYEDLRIKDNSFNVNNLSTGEGGLSVSLSGVNKIYKVRVFTDDIYNAHIYIEDVRDHSLFTSAFQITESSYNDITDYMVSGNKDSIRAAFNSFIEISKESFADTEFFEYEEKEDKGMELYDGIPLDSFTEEDLSEERYELEADNIDFLYDFYRAHQSGLGTDGEDILEKEEFIKEVSKGYGNSDFLECSRIITHESGFYYDNEFDEVN